MGGSGAISPSNVRRSQVHVLSGLRASLLSRTLLVVLWPYAPPLWKEVRGQHWIPSPWLPEQWDSVEGLMQLWLDEPHPCIDP